MRFARRLLATLILVVSCSSERAREASSWEAESSSSVWTAVTELSALDARLGEVLAERAPGEGWEWEEASTSRERMLTSPGYRGASEKRWGELGSRLSERADGVWEVGLSRFSSNRLRLKSREATPSRGELSGGRVLYRGGYGPGLDIVRTTTRTSVEEMIFLRDAKSVMSRMGASTTVRLSWDVELASGMAGHESANGAVEFVDAVGVAVLHVPSPYGVDASGQRRAARVRWESEKLRLSVEFETAGLSFPVLLDPAFETLRWQKVQEPGPRMQASMVYDTKHRRVVLFGGMSDSSSLNDTWEWDGVTWSEVSSVERPDSGASPSMAYDAARGRTVLFGNGQTWTRDAGEWTLMSTPIAPSPRVRQAMAYDAARGRVVLYGGLVTVADEVGVKGDTWEWNGTTWTDVTPETSPGPRLSHSLAYDPKRARIVLYGGTTTSDTWEWDGTTWTQESASSPAGPRSYSAMTYDVARQGVVLSGGRSNESLEVQADAWLWDGATWTLLEMTLPEVRHAHSLAYDVGRGRLVLFGGASSSAGSFFADTRTWDGEQWSRAPSDVPSPPPRCLHSMAYDAERKQIVVFGGLQGSGLADKWTWTWDGTSWKNAAPANSPSARAGHATAYDAKRKRVVLFGGEDSGGEHYGDTWEWNGATWESVTPPESPDARTMSMMAYDAKRERIVLWGGAGADGNSLNDTWEWDGETWTDVTPSDSPSARVLPAMAYDAKRERVVLFGGTSLGDGLSRQDTWEWDGKKWTEATPPAPVPLGRYGHAMLYDAIHERVVLFGGFSSVGVRNDLWSWDGSTWTTIALAPPPARYGHAMAFDEARGLPLLFGGLGSGGTDVFDDTWLLTSRGAGCASDTDCGHAYCVDGVCCEAKHCGGCESCAGTTPGICTAVTNAPDPDSCSGSRSCSGAGECKPSLGESCESDEGCASGHCVEGVCCDTSCSGGCETCLASRKESGESGTCGPVKAGSDSGGTCPDEGEHSCRRNGLCDGTGGCQFYGCATQPTCDGDHTLVGGEGEQVDCSPYKCSGTACKTSCTSVLDCAYPNACSRATRTCEPVIDGDGSLSGCACHVPGGQVSSSSLAVGAAVALGWVGWSRRRRRSSPRLLER